MNSEPPVVLSLTEFRHCAEVVLDHARALSTRADLLIRKMEATEPARSEEPDSATLQMSGEYRSQSETL